MMLRRRKFKFAVIVTLMIMIGMGLVQSTFLTKLDGTAQHKKNLNSRQIVLEILAERLGSIRSRFDSIPIHAISSMHLLAYAHELDKAIEDTQNILHVLKHGGDYRTTLDLNLPIGDQYDQTLHIQAFSPEVIAPISAALSQIENYRTPLVRLVKQKLTSLLQQHDTKSVRAFYEKFVLFSKTTNAFFRRTHEELNHLFYLNRTELVDIEKVFEARKTRYRSVAFLMLILLFAIITIGSWSIMYHVQRLNDSLRHRLNFDALTGLRSRMALEKEPFGAHSIVYMIDIDDFSGINSLYGAPFGNQLLRKVAGHLRDHCEQCTLYRFGGDIFALMLPDLHDNGISIKKQIDFFEDLIERRKLVVQGERIHVGITIGVGVGKDAVAHSMLALDMAKTEKKSYKIYSRRNQHTRRIKEQHHWKAVLDKALREDQIVPFFQPIIDAKGVVSHYECLMRLEQIDEGVTTYLPPTFLETAKRFKLYPPLSRTMIKKSFEYFSKKGSFSINLSYIDIKEPSTKHFLENLILKHNAQGRVMFEILESEAIEDMKFVEAFLIHFRSLGVKIAIDDFGSHYSNLMEIIRFQPDYLKIDGSLIRDLSTDKDAQLAVRSICLFAKKLSIETVAEFVHDQETFDLCRQLGISYFQGYYFSPPVHHVSDIRLDSGGKIIPAARMAS